MFNRIAAAALTLAFSACTPAAQQQQAAPPAIATSVAPAPTSDRIEATYMSWGFKTESWSIQRGGEGKHATYKSPMSGDKPSTESTFSVSAEAFDDVVAKLKPAEAYDGDDSACKLVMTDGPYGEVVWFKGETKLARFGWMLGYDCPRKQPALDAERAGHDAVLALERANIKP